MQAQPDRRVYYHRNGVLVTTEGFQNAGRSYRIADLSGLCLGYGRRDPRFAYPGAIAAAGVALSAPLALALNSFAVLLGGLGLGLVTIAIAALGHRRGRLELHAHHYGHDVILYRSLDHDSVKQIGRAVLRAKETNVVIAHRLRQRGELTAAHPS